MKKERKLSIIVPIYNGEKRIQRCIESILHQTYSNLELILIDDGSSDSSYEIAEAAIRPEKEAGREIVLLRQENRGVADTRNYGISLAAGEYVTFIDQDDYILPDYCERYMRAAGQYAANMGKRNALVPKRSNGHYAGQKEEEPEKRHGADIVIGGFRRITDDGKVTRTVSLAPEEWSKFVVTAPWAHIYRTAFLRENEIKFLSTGIGEDIYFNLCAYACTERVAIIGDTSYRWVNNPVSVSNSRQNTINEGSNPLILLQALKKRLPKENKIGREYEEYYFMRYIVWYFFFTIKGSPKKDVAIMYGRMMKWLRKYYPGYRKNPNIPLSRPKGDPFSIRAIVWLFYRLERVGLMPKAFLFLAEKNAVK